MGKISCVIFLFFTITFAHGQDEEKEFVFATELNAGLLHLGSYVKERPIIFLNQEATYQFTHKFAAGVGVGFDLYPGSLGLPVSVTTNFKNQATAGTLIFTHSYARYLKAGPLFMASNRYMGGMGLLLNAKEETKVKFMPQIGYSFIWDRFGGKSISFFLGIKMRY